MKKALTIISIFCLAFVISCPVFASNIMNDSENTLNGIRDGVQNMASDAGNALGRAKDGISNVINDGANAAKNGANDVMNGTTNNNYTATRTASATDVNNANNTTIWVVLAIAGVAIVGLVWYYAAQINHDRD